MTTFGASACPLCSDWVPPLEEAINTREFRRHLSRHLQQISLEALPLYIEGLAVQETSDRDDVVVHQKGVVLSDQHQSTGSFTGPSFVKGDEVLILDSMSDEKLCHVRVMRTGQEVHIPGEAIRIIGTTTVPLKNSSVYPWLDYIDRSG